jgi:hypothetical protein
LVIHPSYGTALRSVTDSRDRTEDWASVLSPDVQARRRDICGPGVRPYS